MTMNEVKNIIKSIRRHNRKTVDIPAQLNIGGREISCTACDLSLGGVRLKVDVQIQQDAHVIVKIRDKIEEMAKVVWTAEGFVGLNFSENPNKIKTGMGTLATHLN